MLARLKNKINNIFYGLFLQKRRLYTIPLLAIGIVFLLVAIPLPAGANLGSFLAEWIILPIARFIGGLVITLIGILIQIVQYNDFINAPAVAKGWVIVRDVVNMFVIVMMLVIAFATTFRIEEYQYKKLLSKLLIMAVLVNFSKMLTGLFIDFSQVVMLTFVNGFKDAAAGNFVNGFHLEDMFTFANDKKIGGISAANPTDSGDDSAYFTASIMALISMTITLIVVGIYLIVFLLRIAILWLLVIISPIAYVLSAFPGQAKKYSSEWWEIFGKYLTSGPILAFFLWLSLAIMQFDSNAFGTAFYQTEAQNSSSMSLTDIPGAAITNIGKSDVLLSFIINIVMLLGGLWMTQRLGVAGGKLAGSALSKIQHAGATMAKLPFGAGAYLSRKLGAWSAPYRAEEGKKLETWQKFANVGKGIMALGSIATSPFRAHEAYEGVKEWMEHEKKEDITKGRMAGGEWLKHGRLGLIAGILDPRDYLEIVAAGGLANFRGFQNIGRVLRMGSEGYKRFDDEKKQKQFEALVAQEKAEAKGQEDWYRWKYNNQKIKEDKEINEAGQAVKQGEDNFKSLEAANKRNENDLIKKNEILNDLEDTFDNIDEATKNYLNFKDRLDKKDKLSQDETDKYNFYKQFFDKKTGKLNKDSVGLQRDSTAADVETLKASVAKFKNYGDSAAYEKENKEYADNLEKLKDNEEKINKTADIKELRKLSKEKQALENRQEEIEKKYEGVGLYGGQLFREKVARKKKTEAEKALQDDADGTVLQKARKEYEKEAQELKTKVEKLEGGEHNEEYNNAQNQHIQSLLKDIANIEKRRDGTADNKEKKMYLSQIEEKEKEISVLLQKKTSIIADYKELESRAAKGKLAPEEQVDWEEAKANKESLRGLKSKLQAMEEIIKHTNDTGKDWGEEQRKENKRGMEHLMKEISHLEEKSAVAAPPPTFYAQIDRRLLEAEEMKKITTDNYHELVAYFRAAQHDKDPIRMGAIFKKLANDYNDNELINAYGYTSNYQGLRDFCEKELVVHGGMSREHMMALAQDVAQLNEQRHHWESARIVGYEGGKFRWFTPYEHALECLAEIRKGNPRDVARSFNRLAYGGEYMKPDGTRDFKISPLGLGILMSVPGELGQFIGRGETNPNIVVNLHQELELLKKIPELKDPFFAYNGVTPLKVLVNRAEAMRGAGHLPTTIDAAMALFKTKY